MEYLPDDPNEEDPKMKEKTEKKLKEFREYIVDKGVVLMFVKVLLSLKYAENKPRNPIKIIRDYFGKYHDPRWDEMSALKEKIILFNNENAKLLEKAMNLEDELKNLKRTKRIDKLFDSFELDKNGLIGSKYIIEILTGNKKFDVDEKFDKEGLIKFIDSNLIKRTVQLKSYNQFINLKSKHNGQQHQSRERSRSRCPEHQPTHAVPAGSS